MNPINGDLQEFLQEWQDGGEGIKKAFLHLKGVLQSLDGVEIDFKPRQGVTYSLRGKHPRQTNKTLFVMIDVIEGEPRWLSVCFYAEMIDDPEERGDFVPQGLLGEDALCFDLEEQDEELLHYFEERLRQAYGKAGQ